MMRALLIALTVCMHLDPVAQIVLERQVISSFGVNVCDGHCLYSAGGQVDYQGFGNGNYAICSGFEQPDGDLPLYVQINVVFDECSNTYRAEIASISGCANAGAYICVWNGAEGGQIQSGLPSLTSLNVTSSDGCVFEANYDFTQMQVLTMPCDLIIYNYLSPNNDGDNDTWIIENIDDDRYSDNHVRLMNRWGNVVWEVDGYNNAERVFDGRGNDNNVLPDGTYFYVVETGGKEYQGYLELIR